MVPIDQKGRLIMSKDAEHSPVDDQKLLDDAIPIDSMEESTSPEAPAVPELPDAIEIEEGGDDDHPVQEIRTFGGEARHEDAWTRTPNTTGSGAIHVKTFVAKLRLDAVEHLDQQINEWLDAHPQYEVKFVTTSVGDLLGKTKEPALFMSVWV